MLIDFHTHTSKYSKCSVMTGEQLATAAIEAGLDGFVITEHNVFWTAEEIESLRTKFPQIKILSAVEITVQEKEDILVFGVIQPEKLYKGMPLKELVEVVKKYDGFCVLAHPYRYKDVVAEEIFNVDIDGIEIASMNIRAYMLEGINDVRLKRNMIAVACSDAHSTSSVGVFATRFNCIIENERDLVEALRSKDFTVHRNKEFLIKQNKSMGEKIAMAKELIKQGLTDAQVRDKTERIINISMSYAIRNGKDVTYPLE